MDRLISLLGSCWRPRSSSACFTASLSNALGGTDVGVSETGVERPELAELEGMGFREKGPRVLKCGANCDGARRGPAGAPEGLLRFVAANK